MRYNLIIIFLLSQWLISLECHSQPEFSQYLISDQVHGTQSLFACDIDNDGDHDILGDAAEDNDVIFWRNEGEYPLQWTEIIVNGTFSGAGTVTGCDINGDGKMDILAGAKGGDEIAWWENSGGDTILWTKHTIRENYDFPHEVFGCDIDMDGDTDVLAASSLQNELTLWRNEGGTPIGWSEQTIATGFTQAKSVHAGDFNDDGLPDVVGASLLNNEISWWENGGGWPVQWTQHTVTTSFAGAHRVEAVDMDLDGLPDILAAGWYANQIAWWRNDGGNPVGWTKQVIASGFQRTCIAIPADLDEDGDIDVIGTSQDGDEVAWFRNNGGSPVNWQKFSIDPDFDRVWPVCAADFDGDADIDIAAASGHEGNNQFRWYRQTPENILSYPESAVYDPDSNRYLVSCQGTGSIVAIDAQGNQSVFASGFGVVIGLTISGDTLYAVCDNVVRGLLLRDATVVFEHAIPEAVKLNDIAAGTGTLLYVSDVLGDKIFRINVKSGTHEVMADDQLTGPNGILVEEEQNRLLVVSWRTNSPVQSVDLSTGAVSTVIQTTLSNCDGITKDSFGRYYISEWAQGTIQRFNSTFLLPSETIYTTTESPADIWYNPWLDEIAIPLCQGHRVDFLQVYPVGLEKKRMEIIDRLFPNPFFSDAILEIHLDKPGTVQADLFDLTGKLIQPICRKPFPAGTHRIPFSGKNLKEGIYMVDVSIVDPDTPDMILSKEVINVIKTLSPL
ncbi:MAG: hypothetical protein EOM90_13890 [Alphaproteobacteria bacterium]|nr:hypothetical protein [Alphaproteobacteria bacterium]